MKLSRQEAFDDPGALLGILTDEPNVHWSERELQLELGWPDVRVSDALAALERDGLTHRIGSFAWPTRAAVRSRELLA